MQKKFYNAIFNNLSSYKTFYRYNKKNFKYKDIEFFYYSFLKILSKFKKKQNKICILSEKSFNLYSCIVSVLLSNNIWIPISTSLPVDRLKKIFSLINPDVVFCDKENLSKISKIKNLSLKDKIFILDNIKIKKSYSTSDIKKKRFYSSG